jgi:hypothetical protein
MLLEALLIAQKIADVFDQLGIAYFIGGSFASTIHGLPRATRDVDFIADIQANQVDSFVAALEAEFYLDAKTIRSAISHQRSFNVIHLDTMFKADVFVLASTKWANNQLQRRELKPISVEGVSHAVWTCTAEDIILQKLLWFEKGGKVSRQQWDDIQGVLKVNASTLDFEYLKQWSAELGITVLLHESLNEAGITKETL